MRIRLVVRFGLRAAVLLALLAIGSSATAAQSEADLDWYSEGVPKAPAFVKSLGGAVTGPLTVAESSRFQRTSRLDDVQRFLRELGVLEHADRLHTFEFGRTFEGRPLIAVTATKGDESHKLRVLVNANIHGGEIEGKVAVQWILRDIAIGQHADLLECMDITFVPVFNADGNDRIARTNRVAQNGPNGGVGERANGQGLDLNRDFVKVETPEVRALLGLANRIRPTAFFDLHTTNGSTHGYDLTYATSLSPNVAPELDEYVRDRLFPDVRADLQEDEGVFVFDYGNFGYPKRSPDARGQRGDPNEWATYDSRPRFGTNLFGLRGSVSILSEAYSYQSYERRAVSTYAFTLACLYQLAADQTHLGFVEFEAVAYQPTELFVDAQLAPGQQEVVRVGTTETIEVPVETTRAPGTGRGGGNESGAKGVRMGRRRVAAPASEAREVAMNVRRAFVGTRSAPIGEALTSGFAVAEPSDELLDKLRVHLGDGGFKRLEEALEVEAECFQVTSKKRSERFFQGHFEASVEGEWETRSVRLPAGALIVRATRLTAHLLHPESDDSFTTWNVFDRELFPGEDATGDGGNVPRTESAESLTHPVFRLGTLPQRASGR